MSSTDADRVASGPLAAGSVPKEVTWDGLDKRKFFVVGAGMFSCVTCMLYPLTVIKTRQMVDGSAVGSRPPPAMSIVKDIVKERGIPGLYRGFGTIVVGTLPIRFVYLSTTGVYGNRDGERVDESSEPRPESARAERRLAAVLEPRKLLEHLATHRLRQVVDRLAGDEMRCGVQAQVHAQLRHVALDERVQTLPIPGTGTEDQVSRGRRGPFFGRFA